MPLTGALMRTDMLQTRGMWLSTGHHASLGMSRKTLKHSNTRQSIADLIKIFAEQKVCLFLFILGVEMKIMKESDVERLHYNQYIKVPLHTDNNILHSEVFFHSGT